MSVEIEVSWFYEERQEDGRWISAFGGYKFNRAQATEKMERRKAVAPRAVLRLVCVVRKTRSYRERYSP